jgi:signal transduction histidine kinase
MNRLIETLHRYTTVDANVTFEAVDMNRVFEAAVDNLQDPIQEGGAKITSANLPTVLGNASLLIQLLQNLIGNGIKFCDNAVAAVHVEATTGEDGSLLFSVRDNGIGIPEAQTKRVFEPFVRLNGAGKRKGSGLGLATCKKVVERHRGTIWCQSEPGVGTTFFFVLFAAKETEQMQVAELTGEASVETRCV